MPEILDVKGYELKPLLEALDCKLIEFEAIIKKGKTFAYRLTLKSKVPGPYIDALASKFGHDRIKHELNLIREKEKQIKERIKAKHSNMNS